MGIVSALLSSGARQVLAPVGDVDDHETMNAMLKFHRGMFGGQSAPAAWSSARSRAPRRFDSSSAFQVYSRGILH
jgi:CHAT domain-containing protein